MIGRNIKRLRKQAGYSQESLARLLGVTQGAVSQWEQNEREKVEKQWNRVQNEVQTENDT